MYLGVYSSDQKAALHFPKQFIAIHSSPNVLHMKIILIFWSHRLRPRVILREVISKTEAGSLSYYYLTNLTWPGVGVTRRTGWSQCALLLEKTVWVVLWYLKGVHFTETADWSVTPWRWLFKPNSSSLGELVPLEILGKHQQGLTWGVWWPRYA